MKISQSPLTSLFLALVSFSVFACDHGGNESPPLKANCDAHDSYHGDLDDVVCSNGRVWMDRNLGASQVATSSSDEHAYGDLYQWGRATDGHEKRLTIDTTLTQSSNDNPGHGDFIIGSPDWRNPQNNNLWQGENGINSICPSGFRLPTNDEWEIERSSWRTNDLFGAFASPLKLVVAGSRNHLSGNIENDEKHPCGLYWSSTPYAGYSKNLRFISENAETTYNIRTTGLSVRCIASPISSLQAQAIVDSIIQITVDDIIDLKLQNNRINNDLEIYGASGIATVNGNKYISGIIDCGPDCTKNGNDTDLTIVFDNYKDVIDGGVEVQVTGRVHYINTSWIKTDNSGVLYTGASSVTGGEMTVNIITPEPFEYHGSLDFYGYGSNFNSIVISHCTLEDGTKYIF